MMAIVTFISHNLLPGPILKLFVIVLRIALDFVGGLSSLFLVDTSALVVAEAGFTASLTATPTFSRSFYAIFSVFNILELVPTFLLAILLVVIAALAVIVIAAFLQILSSGCGCFNLLYAFYISWRNSQTASHLAEVEEEAEERHNALQQDQDILSEQLAALSSTSQLSPPTTTIPASKQLVERASELRKRV
jgi:signal transduction histidine kinase